MIKTLQAGRFFAAMAVVFHHAIISVAAFVATPPHWAQWFFEFGYLGVDFFFVLSGFIIHYTMSNGPKHALEFAWDRFARIMLPYWPVGLIVAVAYVALPGLSDAVRPWGWVPTLTLLPSDLPPALSVAWTLQHELVFYFVYATLFFSRIVPYGLAAWVVCILMANVIGDLQGPVLKILLAPINVEFVAGVVAAQIFIGGVRVSGILSLSLATVFIIAFVTLGGNRGESWMVGLSIASLLPWLCMLEKSKAFSVPEWMVFGGTASYAIYLIHNPLLSLISRAMSGIEPSWISALIVSAASSAIVGVVYYSAWERPVMRFVKRRKSHSVGP